MTNRVPWKSYIAIFLIFALSTSLSLANADSTIAIPSDRQELSKNTQTSDTQKSSTGTKAITINLSENMGVADKKSSDQNQNTDINQKSTTEIQVNLSEKMSLTLDGNDNNLTSIVKRNSEFQATFDRIWNLDRIRINGKDVSNIAWNDQSYRINSISSLENQEPAFTQAIVNLGNNFKKSIYIELIGNIGKNISGQFTDSAEIISESTILQNKIWKFVHDTIDPKDPLVFLFLVPLSGFILIKSENEKFRISNPRKILSLFFIIIIISSAVATPVSLSPGFIAAAYGEQESNQTISGVSNVNNTGLNDNSTALHVSQFSNSTAISNNTLSFNQFSNSTAISNNTHAGNSNSTTNAVTNPVNSWKFTPSTLNSTSVGDTQLDNSTGTSSLQLNGNGYLKQNITSTTNLSALTLSAWIKPDFSQGSSQFTVISKGNTFILGINNNLPPSKKAFFSIFDGIKWDTVISNSTIPEDWTHLAATFNGTTIALYVNGKQESSQQISSIPTIALNGELTTKTVDNLSSNADVLIGAYVGSRETPSNLFSGLIEDVKLYSSLLSPSQISHLYQSSTPSQNLQINTNISSNSTSPVNATSLANATNINSTITNATSTNDTAIPVTPSLSKTKNSYLITENPEFKFEYFTVLDLKKIKKDTKELLGSVQQNGWTGTNGKIKIDVIGPNGNKVPLKSIFQKLRDGKFDIKLDSLKNAKPGLYKVVVTLTRNGQTYTTQDQFYWGLVSVNTQKSIYRPGDTANFVIVVLDNGGHSVCDSNISMSIVDPTGSTRTLSTGNGITSEQQCGLYDASYTTKSEGNYTVGIRATNPSGIATFNTSFLAENSYPFDIIRTADSKIDPKDNPNSFNVKLGITSFVNINSVTIKETIPSVFNVTTDGTVQTVGDAKTITWNKNLNGNSTSVQYTYSVPLQYPQLYALGLIQINYGLNQTFKEARPWFVAVDPLTSDNQAVTANVQTSTSSLAITPKTTNEIIIVGVAILQSSTSVDIGVSNIKNSTSSTSCTGSTTSLTNVTSAAGDNTGNVRTQFYYLLAQTTKTQNICITLPSTPGRLQWGIQSYRNVDQINPILKGVSNTGVGTTSSVTLTGVVLNNLVIDVATETGTTTPTPGTGQKIEWAVSQSTGNTKLSTTSTNSTATSTTMTVSESWTTSSKQPFSYSVITVTQPLRNVLETLSISDSLKDTKILTRTLSETLSSSDVVTKSPTRTLSETLSSSDSLLKAHTVSLQETLSSSDQTNKALTTTLSETFSSSDQIQKAVSKTVKETLSSSDVVGKSSTTTLQETLSSSDAISKSITNIFSETMTSSDVVSNGLVNTQTLSENLASVDSMILKGGIKIEARDHNNVLVPGAAYSISPNTNGSSTPLNVVDGGVNDDDGIKNGRAVITLVPFRTYNIAMTTIPTGYNVLGNYTIYTTSSTHLNGVAVFRVTPIITNLTTLPPTVITSAPNLNDTVLNNWVANFNAKEHNGTQPTTDITKVQQLPPIISVGSSNRAAVAQAIARQTTVQLDTNFAQETNPLTIINTLGVPVYSVPKTPDVVSVIPAIVAQSSNMNVPTQTVTTPTLDKIVPGQQMVVPVDPSVIPNTGGLKQLDITSNPSVSSTNATLDWFVVKIDNTIPSTIKSLSSSGISDTPTLYINVTYKWEVTNPHKGFDWSNPANFAHPPQLTLQLPKPNASSGIKADANGCPVSNIYLYDPSTQSWTANTVTVISVSPTAGHPSTCDVVVQAQHFSQFALGSPTSGGAGPPSGPSGAGAGAAGSVGVGPAGVGEGTGATSGTGFGGILAPMLKIDSVSYNVCQNNTVRILAEYSDNNPSIILRTSLSGVVQATLAKEQPYAQENVNSTVQKLVYVAPINPKEQSFEVVALQAAGNNVNSVGKTITITGCQETINFENGLEIQQSRQLDESAPKIIDVKYQSGRGGIMVPADTNQFVSSQPITVSAIISSPTPVDKAELRFVKLGASGNNYDLVAMNVAPIPITNTTFTVTGTIPREMLVSPAMTYWLEIHNTAQKTTNSAKYTVGVKPTYQVAGNLEMDITPIRAEGTTAHPTAYFVNNSTGPVYGTVSLVIDGTIVYTSPGTLFGTGQTIVNLEWKAPTIGTLKGHQVYAQATLYDQSLATVTSTLTTFPSVKTLPLSTTTDIESISVGNHTVAKPAVLYSSFKNEGTMRYRVTAPDGTCVIGGSDSCLVTKSTTGNRGNFDIVTISGQTYLVRYSGPDSPLERFSITSTDPIVGKWKVEIDSQSTLLPQAQATNDGFLKVKYAGTDTTRITLPSK